jgi:hypothetical protein
VIPALLRWRLNAAVYTQISAVSQTTPIRPTFKLKKSPAKIFASVANTSFGVAPALLVPGNAGGNGFHSESSPMSCLARPAA